MGDDASLNRSSALQLWAIGTIVPVATILWNILREGLQTDYRILWTAGNLALSGDVPTPSSAGFIYPPHALFFFTPIASLPYVASYVVWNALTAAFFLWAARSYLPKGFPPLLVLLTPGALMGMHFGQTGFLIGGLWMLAFRGYWASVALLTVKPHLGVLSALTLRSRPALVKTILLAIGLVAISMVVFGLGAWREFAENLLAHSSTFATQRRWQFFGVSPAIAYGIIGWLPFAIAAGLLLMRNVNAFTAATAALLVSPYGFTYDMPAASLGIGLAIWGHWQALGWSKRLALMLGFLAPTLANLGVWWIPPILLWTLWVQVGLEGRTEAVTE